MFSILSIRKNRGKVNLKRDITDIWGDKANKLEERKIEK